MNWIQIVNCQIDKIVHFCFCGLGWSSTINFETPFTTNKFVKNSLPICKRMFQ